MTVTILETHDIAACRALRRVVFIEEQAVPEADEIDDLDEVAHHLIAWSGAQAVGTARVVIKGDTAEIGRVCVLPDRRGAGLGAGLIRASLDLARGLNGPRRALLGAQVHAVSFYEKLGFTAFGDAYLDAGILHRDMERDL